MASPTLGRLYPRGNSPVLILQEVEWTPGPVWTRRCEEKSPPFPTPGIEPGLSSPQPRALPLEPPGPINMTISKLKLSPSVAKRMKYKCLRWCHIDLHFTNYLRLIDINRVVLQTHDLSVHPLTVFRHGVTPLPYLARPSKQHKQLVELKGRAVAVASSLPINYNQSCFLQLSRAK